MSTIKEKAENLVNAAQRLNNASDELNRQFNIINEMIGKLAIGIEYTYPIPATDLGIGYMNFEGKWQLVIISPSGCWGITHAPRSYRIKVTPYLASFMEAYHEQVHGLTKEIVIATTLAESFVRSING